jgi:hypothetical protein
MEDKYAKLRHLTCTRLGLIWKTAKDCTQVQYQPWSHAR